MQMFLTAFLKSQKAKKGIDGMMENDIHANVFVSTFRDILDFGWRQGRLDGLRILAAQLKPFGAGPY